MSDVPYQIAPQVAQLQAERENAVAYGNDTRVEAIDRQLAEYGAKQDAAEKRAAAAEGDDDAKRAAPKERSAAPAKKAETQKS